MNTAPTTTSPAHLTSLTDAGVSGSTRHPVRTGRDDVRSLPAALRSEWLKTWTLRSTPTILGLSFAIGLTLTAVMAIVVENDPFDDRPFTVAELFFVSTFLSGILAVVIGVLSFTSEVQHGTLAGVVTARPARWVVVMAKAANAAVVGFGMGALAIAGGLIGSLSGGLEMGDTSGMVVDAVSGIVLTTVAAALGVGVGVVIRHSSAAVASVLVWALVVENLLRSMAPTQVARLLPFSAANGLLGTRQATDTAEMIASAFSRAQNAAIFGGYTLIALVIGTVLLSRRDVA